MGRKKKCLSNVKGIFPNRMLSCYIFYLHHFTFFTIKFKTYNKIDSKTKALFTLYETGKINKRGGPNKSVEVGYFFENNSTYLL